jgi:hypothetical protein
MSKGGVDPLARRVPTPSVQPDGPTSSRDVVVFFRDQVLATPGVGILPHAGNVDGVRIRE